MYFISSAARKRSKDVDRHVAELRNDIDASPEVRAALGRRCSFINEITNNYYVPNGRDRFKASKTLEARDAVPIIPLPEDRAWFLDPDFATFSSAQRDQIYSQHDRLGISTPANTIAQWEEQIKAQAEKTKVRFPPGQYRAFTTGTTLHPTGSSPYRVTSRPVVAYTMGAGGADVLAHEFVHCAQRTESPVIAVTETTDELDLANQRELEAHTIHRDLLVAMGQVNPDVSLEEFDKRIKDFSDSSTL